MTLHIDVFTLNYWCGHRADQWDIESIQGFVPGILLLCSDPGWYIPGWSCSPAGLHSGHTTVLGSETLPGYGGRQGIALSIQQHPLVSQLDL